MSTGGDRTADVGQAQPPAVELDLVVQSVLDLRQAAVHRAQQLVAPAAGEEVERLRRPPAAGDGEAERRQRRAEVGVDRHDDGRSVERSMDHGADADLPPWWRRA